MSGWQRANPSKEILAIFPNARLWVQRTEDGLLQAQRTVENPEGDRWLMHLSISHSGTDGRPGRYPTWDEQKEAVWRFCPGKPMVSYLPPEGDPYVNVHPTTFHWWETDRERVR